MITHAEKTIKSLRKINDFPFYYGKYYGNYKLDDFISGTIKSPKDIVPFFESLFAEQGIKTKLKFPNQQDIGIGCSAFFNNQNRDKAIIGKNFDWKQDPLLLLKTTPAHGYSSLSMVNLNFCDFFNLGSLEHKLLLSPYVPLDGMNEKGLVVSMLSVDYGASYPIVPEQTTVGDFNIIRIILDTCSTLDEAISIFCKYNIKQTGSLPLHYIIANTTESCIIEFFEDKIHIKRDSQINFLTNFLCLQKPDNRPATERCSRYELLKKALKTPYKDTGLRKSKKLLQDLSVYTPENQLPSTIWSLLYIPEDLKMKIKIGQSQQYYSVQLADSINE